MRKDILALFSLFSLVSFSGISGMVSRADQDAFYAMMESIPHPTELVRDQLYLCYGKRYFYAGRGKVSHSYYFYDENNEYKLPMEPTYQASTFSFREFIGWKCARALSEKVVPSINETI